MERKDNQDKETVMKDQSYTLSRLQEEIRESLTGTLTSELWVAAEVSEIRINYSGHAYLELVEKGDDENITAKARAIIWSRKARMILPYFETTAGIPVREGIKILVKVAIDYHKLYGLNLVISDIDPLYSAGDLAVKRREILSRLEREGVISMNRECDFPLFPQRIAIISSEGAAGYQDFVNQLINNQFGYKYITKLYRAAMQGEETRDSVITAFRRIFEDIDETDLVVITRGGGSQSDLGWFDNYDIAYMVTQCPVPVLCGIGHERDNTVTDMVAFRSLKTPTAVADMIIESTAGTEEYLRSTGRRISDIAVKIIREKNTLTDHILSRIIPSANRLVYSRGENIRNATQRIKIGLRSLIAAHRKEMSNAGATAGKIAAQLVTRRKERLTYRKDKLVDIVKNFLTRKKGDISFLDQSIRNMSPENVLARGYSITTHGGKAISDTSSVETGSEIVTRLHKGNIKSRIFDINE